MVTIFYYKVNPSHFVTQLTIKHFKHFVSQLVLFLWKIEMVLKGVEAAYRCMLGLTHMISKAQGV